VAIAVISDLHVGSSVGLWPTVATLSGGNSCFANKYQQWLYACWGHTVREIQALDKPTVVFLGDLIQGVHARDKELMDNSLATQVRVARSLLEPIVRVAERVYIVRGTPWHEGSSSEAVEELAHELGGEVDPSTGLNTWWELYLTFAEQVIHFRHYISHTSNTQYEATAPLKELNNLLAEMLTNYGDLGVRIIVRS